MAKCEKCLHYAACLINSEYNPSPCRAYRDKADVVVVVRCKDCVHAVPLDRNCELNTKAYMHCYYLRGALTQYVWHKDKKYYKDYSIVEHDDFCSYGVRKEQE